MVDNTEELDTSRDLSKYIIMPEYKRELVY